MQEGTSNGRDAVTVTIQQSLSYVIVHHMPYLSYTLMYTYLHMCEQLTTLEVPPLQTH